MPASVSLTRFVTRSLITCVPLQQGGERHGVLQFVNKRDGGSYGEIELELTSRLAVQATSAIRSRSFSSDLRREHLYAKPENCAIHGRSAVGPRLPRHARRLRRSGSRICAASRVSPPISTTGPIAFNCALCQLGTTLLGRSVLAHNGIANKARATASLPSSVAPTPLRCRAMRRRHDRRRLVELHERWRRAANFLIGYLGFGGSGTATKGAGVGGAVSSSGSGGGVGSGGGQPGTTTERRRPAAAPTSTICDQLGCNALGKRGIKPVATLRLSMSEHGEPTQGRHAYHIEDQVHAATSTHGLRHPRGQRSPGVGTADRAAAASSDTKSGSRRSAIPPGQTWDKVIYEAIDECFCFVVVVTQNAGNSQYVRSEVLAASGRTHLKNRIIRCSSTTRGPDRFTSISSLSTYCGSIRAQTTPNSSGGCVSSPTSRAHDFRHPKRYFSKRSGLLASAAGGLDTD